MLAGTWCSRQTPGYRAFRSNHRLLEKQLSINSQAVSAVLLVSILTSSHPLRNRQDKNLVGNALNDIGKLEITSTVPICAQLNMSKCEMISQIQSQYPATDDVLHKSPALFDSHSKSLPTLPTGQWTVKGGMLAEGESLLTVCRCVQLRGPSPEAVVSHCQKYAQHEESRREH